jgi:hypothetical protein
MKSRWEPCKNKSVAFHDLKDLAWSLGVSGCLDRKTCKFYGLEMNLKLPNQTQSIQSELLLSLTYS